MATVKSNTYELRQQLYDKQNKSRLNNIKPTNPINSIGSVVTGAFSDLSQTFVEKTSGLTNGDINKLWRAKILLDRLGGPATGRHPGLSRDTSKSGSLYTPNVGGTFRREGSLYKGTPYPDLNRIDHRIVQVNSSIPRPVGTYDGDHYDELPKDKPNRKTFIVTGNRRDRESIHDKTKGHKRNEIIIFNMNGSNSTYQYIVLQNRPPELEFQGETSWAAIKSFGRNVPMYHFTGAEDKIQLQVSWYCNDPNKPWEVIQKCRLLEAWSKSNGYTAGPPVLQLDWGGSGLFDNAYFILTSATYILKQFRDGYVDRRLNNATWKDGKLYPMSATQELVFSRVSGNNPGYSSIYDPNKLEGVKGIGTSKRDNTTNKDQSTLWQQV